MLLDRLDECTCVHVEQVLGYRGLIGKTHFYGKILVRLRLLFLNDLLNFMVTLLELSLQLIYFISDNLVKYIFIDVARLRQALHEIFVTDGEFDAAIGIYFDILGSQTLNTHLHQELFLLFLVVLHGGHHLLNVLILSRPR